MHKLGKEYLFPHQGSLSMFRRTVRGKEGAAGTFPRRFRSRAPLLRGPNEPVRPGMSLGGVLGACLPPNSSAEYASLYFLPLSV